MLACKIWHVMKLWESFWKKNLLWCCAFTPFLLPLISPIWNSNLLCRFCFSLSCRSHSQSYCHHISPLISITIFSAPISALKFFSLTVNLSIWFFLDVFPPSWPPGCPEDSAESFHQPPAGSIPLWTLRGNTIFNSQTNGVWNCDESFLSSVLHYKPSFIF